MLVECVSVFTWDTNQKTQFFFKKWLTRRNLIRHHIMYMWISLKFRLKYFSTWLIFNKVGLEECCLWDVALCRSWVNRRFGGKYRLHLQCRKIREQGASVSRWLHLNACTEGTHWKTPEYAVFSSHLLLAHYSPFSNTFNFLHFLGWKTRR
jgi:hypothetical protein